MLSQNFVASNDSVFAASSILEETDSIANISFPFKPAFDNMAKI